MTLSRFASPIMGANNSPANSRGQHAVRTGRTNRILASLSSRSFCCWRCCIRTAMALCRAWDIAWKLSVVLAISAIYSNIITCCVFFLRRNSTHVSSQLLIFFLYDSFFFFFIQLLFTRSTQHKRAQAAQLDIVQLQLRYRSACRCQTNRHVVTRHTVLLHTH